MADSGGELNRRKQAAANQQAADPTRCTVTFHAVTMARPIVASSNLDPPIKLSGVAADTGVKIGKLPEDLITASSRTSGLVRSIDNNPAIQMIQPAVFRASNCDRSGKLYGLGEDESVRKDALPGKRLSQACGDPDNDFAELLRSLFI